MMTLLRSILRTLGLALGWLLLAIGAAWAFGALWFDFPIAGFDDGQKHSFGSRCFGMGAGEICDQLDLLGRSRKTGRILKNSSR